MNRIVNRLMWVIDLLLPCSMALFLLPFEPRLSTLPIAAWLIIQLIVADRSSRLLQWSWLALVLLSVREWWFNNPPHPASINDGVLLISAIVCASTVTPERWNRLIILPAIGFLPLLFTISSKPWTPNPFVGANQAAYLFGLSFSMLSVWLFVSMRRSWEYLVVFFLASLAFISLWQTGSRAALISLFVSFSVSIAVYLLSKQSLWRTLGLMSLAAGFVYLLRAILSSNSSLPGLKAGSDLGRLLAYQCFAGLPFTGNNRLLYGAGFDRVAELCQVEFQGLTLDHAHNLYLQIWAATGLLGFLGLGLLVCLILQQYIAVQNQIPAQLRMCWLASFIYTLTQGFFDVSLLHWPVALIYTGIILGLPYSFRDPRRIPSVIQ